MESFKRSVYKALSWRVIATLITSLVAYFATGEIILAASIGLIDTVIKLIAYIFHERLWNKIKFGRLK